MWRPIETALRKSGHIIVWCPSNKCTYSVSWRNDATHANGGYWSIWGGCACELYFAPTHWQHPPRQPKNVNGGTQ